MSEEVNEADERQIQIGARSTIRKLQSQLQTLTAELESARRDKERFILVARNEDNSSTITICDSLATLYKETLKAVFGPDEKDWEQDQCDGILDKMKEDGFMDFEGDPPIYWFTGHTTFADAAMQKEGSK